MVPLYTRRGDDGSTSVLGRMRLAKSHPRIATLGELDELSASLGLTRAFLPGGALERLIARIQEDLIILSSEVASEDKTDKLQRRISAEDITRLEAAIDEREKALPPQDGFVLPGPPQSAAALHLARAVCRRAERRLVALHREKPMRPDLLAYINRLSDLLFILAREAAEAH